MSTRFYCIIIILSFSLIGCKSSKNAGAEERNVGNKKTNFIVDQVIKNESQYPKSLSFKAATEMKSAEKTTTFKTSVRMVTDSVIWMSISAYSYEVARIVATPDTVKYISRRDKNFYVGSYDFIALKLGVQFDFYDLQSLILARSFGLRSMDKIKRSNSKKNYVLSTVKKERRIAPENQEGVWDDEFELMYTNWINPESYKVERIEMRDLETQNNASIQYLTFENIGNYSVLSAFKMNIIADKESTISSKFSKIVVDSPLKFPFKISAKYEQIK